MIPVNTPPSLVEGVPDAALTVGIPFEHDLTLTFQDADGDPLTYIATSSDPTVATASISDGSVLIVTPLGGGAATITIEAMDRNGDTISTAFAADVTVPVIPVNTPPSLVEGVPDAALTVGIPFEYDLTLTFQDADGDPLTYIATSSDPTVATASVSTGSTLIVNPLGGGQTTINLEARDADGTSVATSFGVTVNALPAVDPDNRIPNTALTVGAPFEQNLGLVFIDPDGGGLTYTAASSDPAVATATISAGVLSVTAVGGGEATITVTAEDATGASVSASFDVAVNTPPAVHAKIANTLLTMGGLELRKNLVEVFTDPDGDVLAYTATSSGASVVAAVSDDNMLIVSLREPAAGDVATVTVRARDRSDAGISTSFEVAASIAPAPHVNQEVTVLAGIPDSDAASVSFRKGGDVDFSQAAMSTLVDDIYRYTIPASAVTARGVEYYVTAGSARQPVSGVYSIPVSVPGGVKRSSAQPGGGGQGGYRLISAPLDLDQKSPHEVLSDDLGGYDDTVWRLFGLGADDQYVEFPHTSAMDPGRAFWLIVKETERTIDTGSGRTISTARPYAIALKRGWNLIGNPFNFGVPAGNLQLGSSGQSPELRAFNGIWNTAAVQAIEPFEGYAVFNDAPSVDTLFVDPDVSSGSARSIASTPQWGVRILAQCQQARDEDNLAAAFSGAASAWDNMDRPEPPVIGEYVSVYFPHPEWTRNTSSYSTDARPEPLEGETWTFEVTTNIRDKVTLTFEGLDRVPEQFEVWLVDPNLKTVQNLRERDSYPVLASDLGHPRRLELIVGRQDFIRDTFNGAGLMPTSFELAQNIPNPFNPATTIQYGLSGEERVTLAVYDILGQEIVTLVDAEQQAAGHHVAVWDGRDRAGQSVGSGIYIYRLRAGSFTAVRKMILVR